MCLHYTTNSTCPACRTLFRSSTTRVPCWNGALVPWRIHRHGLRCRSERYDRGPDENRMDELCSTCACLPAARKRPSTSAAASPPAYTYYRHGYMASGTGTGSDSGSRARRNSITTITSLLHETRPQTSVSRHACAATAARYSALPVNAWAGCAEIQVDGPRTRWCH